VPERHFVLDFGDGGVSSQLSRFERGRLVEQDEQAEAPAEEAAKR
jgi:hypothetical protein